MAKTRISKTEVTQLSDLITEEMGGLLACEETSPQKIINKLKTAVRSACENVFEVEAGSKQPEPRPKDMATALRVRK